MKYLYLLVIFLSQFICATAHSLDLGTFMRDFASSEAERVRREDRGSLDPRIWDQAYNTGQESTGDYRIKRCFYKTNGGYQFNVNFRRSTCPTHVFVNPETNQVVP